MSKHSNHENELPRRDFLSMAVNVAGTLTIAQLVGNQLSKETTSRESEYYSGPVPPLDPSELTDIPLMGPDTSKFQMDGSKKSGLLDAEQLAKDGIAYHIARSSYKMNEDELFADTRTRTQDAGILFGGYHFLTPEDPTAQADKYTEILDKTGGVNGLLHVIDIEGQEQADGSMYGPTYDHVLEFIERYNKNIRTGRLIIYTANYYWGNKQQPGILGNPAAPADTELWWSRPVQVGKKISTPDEIRTHTPLPSDPEDPWPNEQVGTWKYPAFRQVTYDGHLQQFDGKPSATDPNSTRTVDMNVSYFPLDRLRQLAGLR